MYLKKENLSPLQATGLISQMSSKDYRLYSQSDTDDFKERFCQKRVFHDFILSPKIHNQRMRIPFQKAIVVLSLPADDHGTEHGGPP